MDQERQEATRRATYERFMAAALSGLTSHAGGVTGPNAPAGPPVPGQAARMASQYAKAALDEVERVFGLPE
jgi:hypothetical protein